MTALRKSSTSPAGSAITLPLLQELLLAALCPRTAFSVQQKEGVVEMAWAWGFGDVVAGTGYVSLGPALGKGWGFEALVVGLGVQSEVVEVCAHFSWSLLQFVALNSVVLRLQAGCIRAYNCSRVQYYVSLLRAAATAATSAAPASRPATTTPTPPSRLSLAERSARTTTAPPAPSAALAPQSHPFGNLVIQYPDNGGRGSLTLADAALAEWNAVEACLTLVLDGAEIEGLRAVVGGDAV